MRILWALSTVIVLGIGSIVYQGFALAESANPDPKTAHQILREIDDLWRGKSSHALISMQVKTKHYTRTMQMEAWSKGKEQTLVRITSPLKEKGMATLKSGNNIFTYLPRTDRTIRLTSGMMMGSWMGSHFTNDDLVKETRREDDYNASISFSGKRENQEIIEFTLMPKPDAAVVWGKVVLTVKKQDYLPLTEVFYDEDMVVARTFSFSEIKLLAGRQRPSVMQVIPADKPQEYTTVIYDSLALDVEVQDSYFSLSRLKKR